MVEEEGRCGLVTAQDTDLKGQAGNWRWRTKRGVQSDLQVSLGAQLTRAQVLGSCSRLLLSIAACCTSRGCLWCSLCCCCHHDGPAAGVMLHFVLVGWFD